MLDIIFLSYGEAEAETRWETLRSRFPWAMRVDGVPGIAQAHRVAAERALTHFFYVVDADAEVLPDFDFSYTPPCHPRLWRSRAVHVWFAQNPVNDLIYGYGGIKCFPRREVLAATNSGPDFTTSLGAMHLMETVASVTRFNSDPFAAWRSGFREAVKLASGCMRDPDPRSAERLDIWCSRGSDRPFGPETIAGARFGRDYGTRYANDPDKLALINDFDHLLGLFGMHEWVNFKDVE